MAQQVYPVNLSGVLIPPYSTHLSDYGSTSAQNLMFTATLNDPIESSRNVYFRLTIYNDGQELMQTNPNISQMPFQLFQHTPELITGTELAAYLDVNSMLNANGGTASNLIPEGFNRFCLEVMDAARQVPISKQVCVSGLFKNLEPPILSLPDCNTDVQHIPGQNMTFRWLPRHLGLANAPNIVEYDFQLVELLPNIADPNDGFTSGIQIHQTTSMTSTLLYTEQDPPLEKGKTYAWRVQIKDPMDTQVFDNDGYSNICTFTYGGDAIIQDFEVPLDCNPSITKTPEINRSSNNLSSEIFVGDELELGYFKMKVAELSATGGAYSGKGTIHIPFLKSNVSVAFDRIKITPTKRVFSVGNVSAITDAPMGFTPEDLTPARIKNVMNPNFLDNLHTFTTNPSFENRKISKRNEGDKTPIGLPLIFDKQNDPNGNSPSAVIFDIQFTERTAFFTVLGEQVHPATGNRLPLAALEIPITPYGVLENSSLNLLSDLELPMPDGSKLFIYGNGTTADLSCNGIGKFRIDGAYEFSKKTIVAVKKSDKAILLPFQAEGSTLTDFAAVTKPIKEFQLPNTKDYIFSTGKGIFDFSVQGNPKIIKFPSNYTATTNDDWKGFGFADVSVKIPTAFEFGGKGKIKKLTNGTLVIDDTRAWTVLEETDIISLEDGEIEDWNMSIDTLKLEVSESKLGNSLLVGQVKVPIIDEPFSYNGTLDTSVDGFDIVVHPNNGEKGGMSLWRGNIVYANQAIVKAVSREINGNSNFIPYADLHGRFNNEINTTDFKDYLDGDKDDKVERLKRALGITQDPDVKVENLNWKGLEIDPLAAVENRYSITDYDKDNAKITIGGKTWKPTSVQVRYEPNTVDGHNEIGLELVVTEGDNVVAITIWARKGQDGKYILQRINVDSKVVDCDCFVPIESDFRWGENYDPITDGMLASKDDNMGMFFNVQFPYQNGKITIPYLNNLQLEVDDVGGSLVAKTKPLGVVDVKNIGLQGNAAASGLDVSNIQITTGFIQDVISHTNNNPSQLPINLTPSLEQLLGANYDATKYPWPANMHLFLVGFEVAANRETAKAKLLLLAQGESDQWFAFGNGDVLFKPDLVGFKDLKLFLSDDKVNTDNTLPFTYKKSLDNLPEVGSYAYMKCEGFQHFNVQGIYASRHAKKVNFKTLNNVPHMLEFEQSDSLQIEFIIGGNSMKDFIAPIKSSIGSFSLKIQDKIFDGSKVFDVTEGYVDYHTGEDHAGMPQEFFSTTGQTANTFRGIFLPKTDMTLWGFYSTKSGSKERLKIPFDNMAYLHSTGFWGENKKKDVVKPTDNASTNGWKITMDSLNFELKDNLFEKREIAGGINIPLLEDDKFFDYVGSSKWDATKKHPVATFEADTTKLFDKLYDVPAWSAVQMVFKSGSAIEFGWDKNEFLPKADLTGAMGVYITPLHDAYKNLDSKVKDVLPLEFTMGGIVFENLKINHDIDSTIGCYGQEDIGGIKSLSVGSWGFDPAGVATSSQGQGGIAAGAAAAGGALGSKSSALGKLGKVASAIANFGLSVNNIKLSCADHDGNPKYKLEFVITIDLFKEESKMAMLNNIKNASSHSQTKTTTNNHNANNAKPASDDDDPLNDVGKLFGDKPYDSDPAASGLGGGANAAATKPSEKNLTRHDFKIVNDQGNNYVKDPKTGNIVRKKKKGLLAKGKFGIWFDNKKENNETSLEFDHISVEEVYIKAQYSYLNLEGALIFIEKDPVYGDGLKGYIDVTYGSKTEHNVGVGGGQTPTHTSKSKGGFGGKAIVQFGNTKYNYNNGAGGNQQDPYEYFFVDLEMVKEKGIGGKVTLHGIGGGFYFNMASQKSNALLDLEDLKAKENGQEPPEAPKAKDYSQGVGLGLSDEKYKPGKSLSGFQYYPQIGSGGGYLNGIFSLFNFPQGLSFDAGIRLELASNSSDELTLGKIGLFGNAYTMAPSISKRREAPGKGRLEATYDHTNKAFTVDAEWNLGVDYPLTELSAQGTFGLLLQFKDDEIDWFFKAGKPAMNKRISSKFSSPFFSAPATYSYFQMGEYLDAFPELSEVIPGWTGGNINGSNPKDLPNPPDFSNGSGIATGMKMELLSQNLDFLIFKAYLDAAIGFDMSLKQYGKISCGPDNAEIGVNGWYAQGQAYAYLRGGMAMDISIPFFSGEVKLFDFMLAAALRAELPNPNYFLGRIQGSYSVLNGLIEGDMNYKLEFGERCAAMAANPLAGIKMIQEVIPGDTEQSVPIYTNPTVTFTMPVGKIITVESFDSNGNTYEFDYKAYFKKFELKEKYGSTINGTPEIAENFKSATLVLEQMLKPQTEYTLEVHVGWKKYDNNQWNDLAAADESKTVTFKTGSRPDVIVSSSVEYQAPSYRQRYWHKGYAKGQLLFQHYGWDYLFPNNSTKLKEEMVKDGKDVTDIPDGIPFEYKVLLSEFKNGQEVSNHTLPLDGYPGTEQTIVEPTIVYKSGDNLVYQLPTVESQSKSGKTVAFNKINDLNLKKGSIYRLQIIRQPKAGYLGTTTANAQTNVNNQSQTDSLGIGGQQVDFGANINKNITQVNQTSAAAASAFSKILYEYHFGISKHDDLSEKLKTYTLHSSTKGEPKDKYDHPHESIIPTWQTVKGYSDRYYPAGSSYSNEEPLDKYDRVKMLKNLRVTTPSIPTPWAYSADNTTQVAIVDGAHPWEQDMYFLEQRNVGYYKGNSDAQSFLDDPNRNNRWIRWSDYSVDFAKNVPHSIYDCTSDKSVLNGLQLHAFALFSNYLYRPYYEKRNVDGSFETDVQHWAFRLRFNKGLLDELSTSEITQGKIEKYDLKGQIDGLPGTQRTEYFAFEDGRERILKSQYVLAHKTGRFALNPIIKEIKETKDFFFVSIPVVVGYDKSCSNNISLMTANYFGSRYGVNVYDDPVRKTSSQYDFNNKYVMWDFPKVPYWERFDEEVPDYVRNSTPKTRFKLPIGGSNATVSQVDNYLKNKWTRKIYRQGEEKGTLTPNSATPYMGTGDIIIGNNMSYGGAYHGWLDDLKIWDTALNDSEVYYNYQNDGAYNYSEVQVPHLKLHCDFDISDTPKNEFVENKVTGNRSHGWLPVERAPSNDAGAKMTHHFIKFSNINLAAKPFTISFWASRTELNDKNYWILAQGTAEADKYLHIGFRSNHKMTLGFYGNDINTYHPYKNNDWNHWTFVVDKMDEPGTEASVGNTVTSNESPKDDFVVQVKHDGIYSDTYVNPIVYHSILFPHWLKKVEGYLVIDVTNNELLAFYDEDISPWQYKRDFFQDLNGRWKLTQDAMVSGYGLGYLRPDVKNRVLLRLEGGEYYEAYIEKTGTNPGNITMARIHYKPNEWRPYPMMVATENNGQLSLDFLGESLSGLKAIPKKLLLVDGSDKRHLLIKDTGTDFRLHYYKKDSNNKMSYQRTENRAYNDLKDIILKSKVSDIIVHTANDLYLEYDINHMVSGQGAVYYEGYGSSQFDEKTNGKDLCWNEPPANNANLVFSLNKSGNQSMYFTNSDYTYNTYADSEGMGATVAFWYRRDTLDKKSNILDGIAFSAENKLTVEVFNKSNAKSSLVLDEQFTDLAWHHWTFVSKKRNGEDELDIYRDKKLIYNSKKGSLRVMKIAMGYAAADKFNGYIDDYKIWNKELTIDDILKIYDTNSPANKNLVIHLDFDDDYMKKGGIFKNKGTGQDVINNNPNCCILEEADIQSTINQQLQQPYEYSCVTNDCALVLNGSDTKGATQTALDLNNKSFTVELWVKRDKINNDQDIIASHGTGTTRASLHFGFLENNKFSFRFWGDDLDTPESYTDTDWHHWAMVFDNNTKTQRIFRDGQKVAERQTGGSYTGNNPFEIGHPSLGMMQGRIDELRIWDVAKTETEIQDSKDKEVSESCPNILLYYKFNTKTGKQITSETSTGNITLSTVGNYGGWRASEVTKTAFKDAPCEMTCSTGDCALVINNDNAYAESDAELDLNNESFTIEFLAKGLGDLNGNILTFGDIKFGFAKDKFGLEESYNTSWQSFYSDAIPSLDTWHHWAATYNKDSKKLNLFQDGLLVKTHTINVNLNCKGKIHLGGSYGSNLELDELRIWKGIRLAQDILAYKDKAVPPSCQDLLVYYKFDTQSGTTVSSETSQGNGSLNNANLGVGWKNAPIPKTDATECSSVQAADFVLDFSGGEKMNLGYLEPRTIEFWVKKNSDDGIIYEADGQYGGNCITKLSIGFENGKFTVKSSQTCGNGGPFDFTITDSENTDTEWHHWAIVSSFNNPLFTKLYKDGNLVASHNVAIAGFLGNHYLGSSTFDGQIDEVRVWSKLRSRDEIRTYAMKPISANESNLERYYTFNGFPDVTVADQTNKQNITLASNANIQTAWKPETPRVLQPPANFAGDYSLYFDGADNYLKADIAELNLNEFSIEFKANPSVSNGKMTILSYQKGTSSPSLEIHMENRKIYVNNQSNISTKIDLENWHHYAITYKAGTIRIYYSGYLVDKFQQNITLNADKLSIGGNLTGNNLFKGMIDEVRIWNKQLTQEDILGKINSNLQGSESNLLAYYQFNDGGSSSSTIDKKGGSPLVFTNMDNNDWLTPIKPSFPNRTNSYYWVVYDGSFPNSILGKTALEVSGNNEYLLKARGNHYVGQREYSSSTKMKYSDDYNDQIAQEYEILVCGEEYEMSWTADYNSSYLFSITDATDLDQQRFIVKTGDYSKIVGWAKWVGGPKVYIHGYYNKGVYVNDVDFLILKKK